MQFLNLKDRVHHATTNTYENQTYKQRGKLYDVQATQNAELAFWRLALLDQKQLALLQYHSIIPCDHKIVAHFSH